MRTLTRHCVAALGLALFPGYARAQAPPRPAPDATEWFAGAAAGATISRSGAEFRDNPSILAPGIAGSALEGRFTGGAFVTPRLGFAAEFSAPRSFRVHQTWGRDASTWDNEHRDLSLSGLVLIRNGVGRTQITGVMGAGSAWSRTKTVRQFRRAPSDPPSFSATSTRQVTDLALVAGAELNVSISTHVSLGPQFRLIFVSREKSNSYDAQLASVLYHTGVGVRIRFW